MDILEAIRYLKDGSGVSSEARVSLTEAELQEWRDRIDKMTAMDCVRLYRFAPTAHPVFRVDLPLFDYFLEHFNKLGGMTPEISKAIGW